MYFWHSERVLRKYGPGVLQRDADCEFRRLVMTYGEYGSVQSCLLLLPDYCQTNREFVTSRLSILFESPNIAPRFSRTKSQTYTADPLQ
jgi:hypothetical protein